MESILPGTSETQKPPERSAKAKRWMKYIGIGFIVLLFALFNVFVYLYSQGLTREKLGLALFERLRKNQPQKAVQPTPTSSPTPTPKPIPTGKQTFSVSSGKKTGPQFLKGEIDPYDPVVASTQRVSVTIRSAKPVTAVEALLAFDGGKTIKQPMKLASGSATLGIWEVSWAIPGSYAYTYNLTLKASDGTEESKVELTLR